MKKYFVRPSFNIPGWWAVLYLNEVETPTLFCETHLQDYAHTIANLLNENENLHQASEEARKRLASFDRLLIELEGLANSMRLSDAARLIEAHR